MEQITPKIRQKKKVTRSLNDLLNNSVLTFTAGASGRFKFTPTFIDTAVF